MCAKRAELGARGPEPALDAEIAAFIAEKASAASALELDREGLALAFRAAKGVPAAIDEVKALLGSLRGALRRTGADDALVDELLDDLPSELVRPREGAPPRILGYSGKGPIGGWLRVIAARAIVERRKKKRPSIATSAEVGDRLVDVHDPELALMRRKYKAELERAFGVAFRSLPAEARLLLTQHHHDGLSVDQLAALHGVHRATAARRVAAARATFTAEVRAVISRELSVGEETFASIVRLVESDLSLHLSRFA